MLVSSEEEIRTREYWKDEESRKYKGFNCGDMLKSAGLEIKVMSQMLDRIIPANDRHTVLT